MTPADAVFTWLFQRPMLVMLLGVGVWMVYQFIKNIPPSDEKIQILPKDRRKDDIYRIVCHAFNLQPPVILGRGDIKQATVVRRNKREIHKAGLVQSAFVRRGQLQASTVVIPPEVDTAPGSQVRRKLESVWRETFPVEGRWTFDWGATRLIARAVEALPQEASEAAAKTAKLLGWPDGTDPDDIATVELQGGALAGVTLTVPPSFPFARSDRKVEVQQAIDIGVPSPLGAWEHVWNPHSNRYRVVPTYPLPTYVEYPDEPNISYDRIPFGIGFHGEERYWHANTEDGVHTLVCGTTGSGKTLLARNIITGFLLAGASKVYIIDPKRGRDWIWLEQHPRVELALKLEEIHAAVRSAHKLMEKRLDQRREEQREAVRHGGGDIPISNKRVLLYVDELASLFSKTGNQSQSGRMEDEIRADITLHIGKIASMGRDAGVHECLATHRPSYKVIAGDMKINIQYTIGLGNIKPVDAQVIFGSSIAEAKDELGLSAGVGTPGRGLIQAGSMQLVPVQTYFLSVQKARRLLGLEDVSVVAADNGKTDEAEADTQELPKLEASKPIPVVTSVRSDWD